MKNQTRLNPRHQEECVPTTRTQEGEQVFPTPEDALRADRRGTAVPRELSERLAASLARSTRAPQSSWWKRLLGFGP
jgi:hypothetical protein